jgi:hypothetical protein
MVNVLTSGRRLKVDEQLIPLTERTALTMQGDGNLVLYRADDGIPLWASNTAGRPVNAAVTKADGNFVCYGPDGGAYWVARFEYDGHKGVWPVRILSTRRPPLISVTGPRRFRARRRWAGPWIRVMVGERPGPGGVVGMAPAARW